MLARDVGIRFKGVEKTNVEEYCVSEGWIRVAAGNAKDRYGNPLTIKLTGPVEPYFREQAIGIETHTGPLPSPLWGGSPVTRSVTGGVGSCCVRMNQKKGPTPNPSPQGGGERTAFVASIVAS